MGDRYDFETLLAYYASGKLCKPDIQRGYVWADKKAPQLLESLYRSYPIGMLLLWEPPNSQHLIELKEQKGLKNPTLAIIDGQQRLTALHLIKTKKIPVIFNWETEKFDLEQPRLKGDQRWIRVSEIWDNSWNNHMYLRKFTSMKDEKKDTISNKLHTVKNILKIYPIIEYITHDNYEEITDIFIVLNKSARPIKPDELLFAVGILKFPKYFGKQLKKLNTQYADWQMTSKKTGPNKFFIQALSCISTQQAKLKDPGETMKKYLYSTTESKIAKNFKNVEQGLDYATQFLDDNIGINIKNNTKFLSSVYPVLSILNFLVKNKFALNEKEKVLLKLWTFVALHHARFSHASETTLNEDLRVLHQPNLKPEDVIKEWINEIKKEKGGLQVTQLGKGLNTSNYFTLFFALELSKAKDWFTGTSIRALQSIEFHHIFPRKVLKGKYEDSEINDPRNMAIISEKLNRKIRDTPPQTYFRDKSLIQNNIYTQFIPKDQTLLEIKNYKMFLEKRGELIKKEINKYIKTQEKKFKL